jgi:four helix bundle protein
MSEMERIYESFEELNAYKMAREIRQEIAILAKEFPKHENFRLTDQIIRSSRSVTANIAEGHGRHYPKENMKFCIMARGSLNETIDHLTVALDEKYIELEQLVSLKEKILLNIKVLNGYMSYLKKLIDSSR